MSADLDRLLDFLVRTGASLAVTEEIEILEETARE